MLSCKEVSKLVSEGLDQDLPLGSRMSLRMHLVMCKLCGAYARQVRALDGLLRGRPLYAERAGEPALSEGARRRILERIRRRLSGESGD